MATLARIKTPSISSAEHHKQLLMIEKAFSERVEREQREADAAAEDPLEPVTMDQAIARAHEICMSTHGIPGEIVNIGLDVEWSYGMRDFAMAPMPPNPKDPRAFIWSILLRLPQASTISLLQLACTNAANKCFVHGQVFFLSKAHNGTSEETKRRWPKALLARRHKQTYACGAVENKNGVTA